MRGAIRTFELVCQAFTLDWPVPHWTTLRGWILRIGLAELRRPLVSAEDWAWLIDHSIQIGTRKCMVIMGVRLQNLPPIGECLNHNHLQLIALVVTESSTKEQVAEQLQAATSRGGVPRVIVDDHGADLHGGVTIFRQKHPETIESYDIKHKAACLLKKLLNEDPRWTRFQHALGQAKFATQQTPLAYVAPPSQRSKARFMNLEKLIRWGEKLLGWIEGSRQPGRGIELNRIREKFSWLTEFREPLQQWSAWQVAIDTTVDVVRRRGIYRGVEQQLKAQLPANRLAQPIQDQLITFVKAESEKTNLGERVPGSTEVLESCFGKLKYMERNQANSGFTSLVLGLGAMTADLSESNVASAFRSTPIRAVWEWTQKALGATVQSLRRHMFANAPEMKQIPDEIRLGLT
jgi:hypothetical protein